MGSPLRISTHPPSDVVRAQQLCPPFLTHQTCLCRRPASLAGAAAANLGRRLAYGAGGRRAKAGPAPAVRPPPPGSRVRGSLAGRDSWACTARRQRSGTPTLGEHLHNEEIQCSKWICSHWTRRFEEYFRNARILINCRPNGPGRRVTFSAWMGLVRAPLDADVDLKTFDGDAAVTEVRSSAGGRHLRLR